MLSVSLSLFFSDSIFLTLTLFLSDFWKFLCNLESSISILFSEKFQHICLKHIAIKMGICTYDTMILKIIKWLINLFIL